MQGSMRGVSPRSSSPSVADVGEHEGSIPSFLLTSDAEVGVHEGSIPSFLYSAASAFSLLSSGRSAASAFQYLRASSRSSICSSQAAYATRWETEAPAAGRRLRARERTPPSATLKSPALT